MELGRILIELAFFLVLVAICELLRQVARRRCPESALAQGLRISTLVLLWYSVSITLILFNKWIMVHWREDGMPFPIFYTMSHMFLKGVFSSSYIVFVKCKRLPRAKRKAIWGASFVGVMTGMDVVASNLSFLYISVSFYTMMKSASLIFILVLATSARIEQCSWQTFGTISIISAGAFVMTYGEVQFDLSGFSLVMGSEVAAAMRWLATQVLVKDKSLDAMGAVLYMSPASTLSLLPLTILREHNELLLLKDIRVAAQYTALVIFPGFLAFLLLVVEVLLVKETSSLTLSVFGNLKSVVTILLSIIVFKEKTTAVQWVGLSVALLGMFAYSYVKQKHHHVDGLASLGYETLDQEDEPDIENDKGKSPCGIEVRAVLDDLEDLSTDAPACSDSSLPCAQRVTDAPEAACVGKLRTEAAAKDPSAAAPACIAPPPCHDHSLADGPEAACVGKPAAEGAVSSVEDQEDGPEAACAEKPAAKAAVSSAEDQDQPSMAVCATSPSSCSQSSADVRRTPLLETPGAQVAADVAEMGQEASLETPSAQVAADVAEVRLEERVAPGAPGADDAAAAVEDSACDAKPESPSLRRIAQDDEAEGAAATVGGACGDGAEPGLRNRSTPPTAGEDKGGDGNEGTSDNTEGSWCIEDGASSPAWQGGSVKAVEQLDAAAVVSDEDETF
mmetsp:Transcript_65260/g.120160  ORF Transcript_65260/g.120160 Transcript_65260/m.120160 type:complete len:676 (-) Transcript_65260:63-2090(-)